MRPFRIFLLLILPVALFSGCLQVDTTVRINKDGSGTIEEVVLMSNTVIAMMNEFMSSFQDTSGVAEEFKLFKEEELIQKGNEYGEGVKYVSGEELAIEGWEGYKAIYAFDDLNSIRMETDPNKKMQMEEGDSGVKDEYFSFRFIPGNVAELIIDRPEMNTEGEEESYENEETSGEENQLDDKLIKMMDGMRVKISLLFNGEIVNTNATYVNNSEVTMLDIDFSELLKNKESLEKFKKNPPGSLDEMKAIVENIPGMKVELQKPVSIKFK